jgi:integrase
VVHTDELTAHDRAAAILVVVPGQHIENVIRLTWDEVTVTDEDVTIRLGKTEFRSPLPLRRAHATRRHFRERPHGGPTNSKLGIPRLLPRPPRSRLELATETEGGIQHTGAVRLGTLLELTKLDPAPIIADALGYHPSTIERHAIGSASTHAEHVRPHVISGARHEHARQLGCAHQPPRRG